MGASQSSRTADSECLVTSSAPVPQVLTKRAPTKQRVGHSTEAVFDRVRCLVCALLLTRGSRRLVARGHCVKGLSSDQVQALSPVNQTSRCSASAVSPM